MNILFTTQSQSLGLFEALGRELAARGVADRLGFTVADRWAYHNWIKGSSDFERVGHVLVKDWDITAERAGKPDLDRLTHYEKLLGQDGPGPGLFGAIVADRRLLMGPDCTYSQDYRRRFSDDELMKIIETACIAVERAFDELRPDLVVGFICVSLLEYIAFLFARARGIRYLNLRTSRIENRVFLADTHRDPAPEVAATYAAMSGEKGMAPEIEGAARTWVENARAQHAKYEGVSAPSAKPVQCAGVSGGKLTAPFRFARRILEYRASGAADDNHAPGLVRPLVFKAVINPVRARRVEQALRPTYVKASDLKGQRFAVFPLHTEPEISLLLYGRPYVNQIEIVRALAFSLPADMALVIKEHPWMVGKRNLSAYRKLLNIPRVRIAAPELSLRDLMMDATMVSVLTGSSALEAAVLQKPVLTLGPSSANLLPKTMVAHCTDWTLLPETIASLLDGHTHDEGALVRLVAASMAKAAPLNLYSGLLGRGGTYAPESRTVDEDVKTLADFLIARAGEPFAVVPLGVESGSW